MIGEGTSCATIRRRNNEGSRFPPTVSSVRVSGGHSGQRALRQSCDCPRCIPLLPQESLSSPGLLLLGDHLRTVGSPAGLRAL